MHCKLLAKKLQMQNAQASPQRPSQIDLRDCDQHLGLPAHCRANSFAARHSEALLRLVIKGSKIRQVDNHPPQSNLFPLALSISLNYG